MPALFPSKTRLARVSPAFLPPTIAPNVDRLPSFRPFRRSFLFHRPSTATINSCVTFVHSIPYPAFNHLCPGRREREGRGTRYHSRLDFFLLRKFRSRRRRGTDGGKRGKRERDRDKEIEKKRGRGKKWLFFSTVLPPCIPTTTDLQSERGIYGIRVERRHHQFRTCVYANRSRERISRRESERASERESERGESAVGRWPKRTMRGRCSFPCPRIFSTRVTREREQRREWCAPLLGGRRRDASCPRPSSAHQINRISR